VKIARFFERFDDWINPIVIKEVRQAVKSRVVIAALLIFLLLEVFILGAMLLFGEMQSGGELDFQAGQRIFMVLQGVLLGTCLVLIPIYAGVRLASERSDTNVDLLFISTLKPRAIISGKFFAAVILALLIFSACSPFMTFTYLLRGIDMATVVLVLGFDLLMVLLCTMFALYLASIPGNRALKIFLGLTQAPWFFFAFGGAMTVCEELLRQGSGDVTAGWFWARVTAVAGGTGLAIGLFFVWAVAMLSPPSANRALPVRLYQLFAWVALAVFVGWLALEESEPEMIFIWEIVMTLVFALQILISTNERDSWGPRVARAIPRNPLLRPIAFLFYSGAAGGIFFGVIMLALTVAGSTLVWYSWPGTTYLSVPTPAGGIGYTPAPYRSAIFHGITLAMILIGLYTYCYALTGAWLRRVIFGDRLRSTFSWLLSTILLAVASILPYLVVFLISIGDSFHYIERNPWITVMNPFVAIPDATSDSRHWSGGGYSSGMETTCLVFTIGWAVLISILSMPWFVRQMIRFRPYSPSRTRRPTTSVPVKEVVPIAVPVPAVLADGTDAPPANGEKSPHVMPAPVDRQEGR
jgi:hypothetical protein